MKRMIAGLCLLAALSGTGGLCAQEPLVRTSLDKQEQHWVGQRMNLVVELLAPGTFSSAVNFDLPDPSGVLLMPPSGSPLVGNETINGVQYTVQRHHLSAWAMRADATTIPSLTARFNYKKNPLDSDEIAAQVSTDAMPFEVALPPGAEGLGTVISARNLQLTEQWDPQPGEAPVEAGAAYTRTITWSAPDIPGMLFPPFNAGTVDGLGIYSKASLNDSTNRGSLQGQRTDTITYVLQRPGQFIIPAARFTWYDLGSSQLRSENLPAVTLNVVANPNMASAAAGEPLARQGWPWRLLATVAAILLLAALLYRERARMDRAFNRVIAPLRPRHLAPLNPSSYPGLRAQPKPGNRPAQS